MITQMTTQEFFRSPAKIGRLLKPGCRIRVTNRGVPAFMVVPELKVAAGLTKSDILPLIGMVKSTEKNLSRDVDKIVYGL